MNRPQSNTQEPSSKPQPLYVGVTGISIGSAVDISTRDWELPKIDWHGLMKLPPFQQFAAEQCERAEGNSMRWIELFVLKALDEKGEQALFSDYCRWHEAKGRWPNETPLGAPRNEE
jgi:hypothetical protein